MTEDIKLALEVGLDHARSTLIDHDQKYQRHPSTESDRDGLLADIELIERALASICAEPEEKLDSTRTALVDAKSYWRPITPSTPRGAKCFLINRHAKSATTGVVDNSGFFTHYLPVPVFDPNEEHPS